MNLSNLLRKLLRRSTTAQSPTYQWVEIGPDNPFNVRILDIRPFTQTNMAVTQSPDIAKSFVQLRQSDGSDLPRASTIGWVSVPCHLEIPFPTEPTDGPLYKATEMEDKWDIYAFESVLYFARSWMGNLIYKAPFRMDNGAAVIEAIESAPEHSDKADQTVFFLVVSHVLGKPFPNPIPNDIADDAHKIAVYSFSSFGRRALCATPDDVTTVSLQNGSE